MRSRRLRRRITVTLIVVVGFIALAPYAIRVAPVRHLLFRLAFRNLNGTVTAQRARVGWFSPPAFYGVEVVTDSGSTLFRVDAMEADVALWRLVLGPTDLGQFRLERPWVSVQVNETGSNVSELLPGWSQSGKNRPREPVSPAGVPNTSVQLRIAGGRFSFQHVDDSHHWEIGGVDVSCGLRRTDGDAPDLLIHEGVWLDRIRAGPQMCDDFLTYIAPVLARTTRAEGEFSIEVDESFLPLGEPERGELAGQLKIHRLDVGPGALARVLAEVLRMPPSLLFANESVVEFKLRNGRVHHNELAFTLVPFQIRTSGSVGLDETLDLTADVTLPAFDVSEDVDAPLRRALSGRTLRLEIGGTLAEPIIDHRRLAEAGLDIVFDAVGNLLQGGPVADDILQRLRERELLSDRPLRPPGTQQGPLRSRLFRRGGLLNPQRQQPGEDGR